VIIRHRLRKTQEAAGRDGLFFDVKVDRGTGNRPNLQSATFFAELCVCTAVTPYARLHIINRFFFTEAIYLIFPRNSSHKST